MEQRMVKCIKLGGERPGLDRAPVPGELGQRVYENVSEEAWKMFKEHFKIIINEYRLDLMSPEADEIFNKQVEEYFFKEGGASLPEEYVPPGTK
jgi:Fe-S cluster biosynthesis and repair protein YggX